MSRRITRNVRARIDKAVQLYKRFTGHEPKYVDTLDIPQHDVLMLIGKCDGVLYSTRRDGRNERYIHKFSGNSRPLLCASFDGTQLYLLGGAYDFTEEGIVDRK